MLLVLAISRPGLPESEANGLSKLWGARHRELLRDHGPSQERTSPYSDRICESLGHANGIVRGKELQWLPIPQGVDDLVFDPTSKRLYAACRGDGGAVTVYHEEDADDYASLGKIASRPGQE